MGLATSSDSEADSLSMANAFRDEILKLTAAERLELTLTDEQREDLERRLEEADADPAGGSSWEEVRKRIRHRPR
jgi:phage shock protein A